MASGLLALEEDHIALKHKPFERHLLIEQVGDDTASRNARGPILEKGLPLLGGGLGEFGHF